MTLTARERVEPSRAAGFADAAGSRRQGAADARRVTICHFSSKPRMLCFYCILRLSPQTHNSLSHKNGLMAFIFLTNSFLMDWPSGGIVYGAESRFGSLAIQTVLPVSPSPFGPLTSWPYTPRERAQWEDTPTMWMGVDLPGGLWLPCLLLLPY